jgi:simple sugar transport system ATP-binding protein
MKDLTLVDVQKTFDSNSVLNGINLTFKEGQVTAILGDNGAGKSTLLKSLSGLVRPTSGQVKFEEVDISSESVLKRRRLGIEAVYQDYALFKNHSVLVNLFAERELSNPFGFLNLQKMRDEAIRLFEELALDKSLLDKFPRELSGGQQQAVAIARAILFKPRVILLDEPTAALGAREVKRTLDLIKEQKAQGKIIILVSHRFQDVFEVADRIVILKNGRVSSDRLVGETSIEGVVREIVS